MARRKKTYIQTQVDELKAEVRQLRALVSSGCPHWKVETVFVGSWEVRKRCIICRDWV